MEKDNPPAYPSSRESARLQGSARYFTGEPCPQDHVAPRYTSNGNCVVCLREAVYARRAAASDLCGIEGCGRTAANGGWCHAHYERWRKNGDLDAVTPIRGRAHRRRVGLCAVEGCEKRRTEHEWCGTHYRRWQKHGDPLFVPEPGPTECGIDGCGKKPEARGLCPAHYAKLRRYGDVEWHRPVLPNDRVNYFQLHARLRKARGSSRAFQCVGDCGRQARHWAWLHGEDPLVYANYLPMCVSCHLRYDHSRDPDVQPWGIFHTPRPRRRAGGPPVPVLSPAPGD